MTFKKYIYNTLQEPTTHSFKVFHDILAIIILFSTILVILETVPSIAMTRPQFFLYTDIVVTIFFSIEYILRIITDKKPGRYIFSAMGLIDIIAIIPSLLLFVTPQISPAVRLLRILRALRILRLFRVIRLARSSTKKASRKRTKEAKELLPFVNLEIYFFALFSVITFSASLLYLFERNVPDTAFATIPDGMWWAIVTVTTVGYGDMVPVTVGGKITASLTMISGFALFALLLSVVGPALQVLLFGSKVDEDNH